MPTLRQKMLLFTQTKPAYLLNDNFKDTVAAGSVNGTLATPTGGARAVTDTENKLSIGNGVASLAPAATPSTTNPIMSWSGQTRVLGCTMIASVTATVERIRAYLAIASKSATSDGMLTPVNTSLFYASSYNLIVGAVVVGTNYKLAYVLRAAGELAFIKGGAFTNWTLVWTSTTENAATVYPTIAVFSGTGTLDFVRVPQQIVAISPLASDAFTRADGAIGNTGGGGSEESGGAGLTWVKVGTWNVATNKAVCAALTGAGFATVNCGSINVMIETVVTRSAGNAGVVARYADANNYIIAYHDGTNMHLDKVVGGTPTSLINAATTYSATARTMLSLNGTGVRLYYNNALIGSQQTVADAGLQTGTSHGLYTTDTGATFDNFVVFAKGNGGEYEAAFNKFTV